MPRTVFRFFSTHAVNRFHVLASLGGCAHSGCIRRPLEALGKAFGTLVRMQELDAFV